LDDAGLAGDARFATVADRAANHVELVAALSSVLIHRPAAEWMERWNRAGLVAGPIQNLKEAADDPQAWANDYFLRTHCGEVDRAVEIRGLPIGLSKTPARVESLGPELGQDTEIILMETLGMEWDRIEELKAAGVIP
jgi:crotonobetainyl-CoA:carnitine CoA-transferase CaiB-like acyl-CoA transferase